MPLVGFMKEKKRATFYLYKNIDGRKLRYLLHKLENVENVDIDTLRRAIEAEKKYKRSITLTEEEEVIIQRLGKSANLLLNCELVKLDEGERA
ncbi:hypothetical protein MJ_0366 [Methanocaldococcus jannaschii DSM 2661]|uniref:Uncharacterized protein MJ0366 n=2 Tax=Methanocaldococcus jannaschii TaxID=2190 RepID=Y366_METJA|nr:RecName: Full=Uncharacterized protein MJ0366 [Methanocaldococcus jannaschii DSM 2661]AAB98357.1 hypothetical protein MJ_0366 [Methanocaldococcus jannaschii DSM 2661]2EFV_A Chain A, Hypothetical protein MJ0366 [Methanocaldococcus jannaschii DSM 2661]